MEFDEMKIDPRILESIKAMKITKPTEIQEKALPPVLEGKDVMAQSMTGSGKTLVFAVPIIQKIEGHGIQALVIAPTRELASQISGEFRKLSHHKKINVCEVYGGVSIEPQIHGLRTANVVIGTPGRILDHMRRGTMDFSHIKTLILDEADRMLDMGFVDDIETIISHLPKHRQTLLFSATLPDEILRIARRYMHEPVRIRAQAYVAKHLLKQYYCDTKGEYKISLLVHLLQKEKPKLAIVFCGTRFVTDIVADNLQKAGIEAKAIHGGHEQSKRMRVLEGFHQGTVNILVATDVAARGLDIKNVSHVFNFDIPKTADEYTHRIGRTARIGTEGKAISLLAKQDHEAFRKIMGKFEIEKLHVEFTPKVIPLRSERSYSRGPPRRGFGGGGGMRRRRY